MKDTVIKLKNNDNYYVLEELNYQGKKYIIATKCDLENETLEEDRLVLLEVKLIDNSIGVDEVYDDELAKELIEKYQKIIQKR